MAITILSRDVLVTYTSIWRFHISSSDASLINANHLDLIITTLGGDKKPSLAVSPFSEIYFGGTEDPFGLVWTVVDNGAGDWSINFIVPVIDTNFTDINDWTNFQLTAPVVVDIQEMLARSPQFAIVDATGCDTVEYKITNYQGEFTDFASYPISYTKSKTKVVPTQSNLFIDVAPLSRYKLELSPVDFYLPTFADTVMQLDYNGSKIMRIDYTKKLLGVTQDVGAFLFYVIDGYRDNNQEMSTSLNNIILPKVLLTGNKRKIERGAVARMHFKTTDLIKITKNQGAIQTDITFIVGNENRDYVMSLDVDTLGGNCSYDFEYPSGTVTQYFYFYDECKYDSYYLIFKNKWGVSETISVNKKSVKELNVQTKDFKRGIVDYNGNFDVSRHSSKQFSTVGDDIITLNTDFLPEYMNDPMRELMLSEEIWLAKNSEVPVPIVKQDQSIKFKTHLNDRLVQYTIKAKMSHNSINNIK